MPLPATLRSLENRNYRVWSSGALVSNIGTWMQRAAQDWLVLTELTHHSATAVGVVMGLQFGPQLLLLPWTGTAADHFQQRRLLMVTQTLMGLLALVLGVLTIGGWIRLWQVDVLAFLFGCAAAFDAPARQTFVGELVNEDSLANAVALNSTSFNAGRMLGPAAAGLIIAALGTGWAFLLNGLSFFAVLAALLCLDQAALFPKARTRRAKGSFTAGLRYVRARPDLMAMLLMLALIGTFGLNFAIYISTMAVMVYHAGAGTYGLLTSTMAVGSIAGALLAAQRDKPSIPLLMVGAGVFGLGCTLAALMPNELLFAATLVIIGISAQTFTTSTLSLAQMTTAPAVRGRVIAIVLAIAMGGTPIGAPIVGRVADSLGPRWALALAGASGFGAALVGARYLARHRGLRFGFAGGRWHWHMDDGELPGDSAPLR